MHWLAVLALILHLGFPFLTPIAVEDTLSTRNRASLMDAAVVDKGSQAEFGSKIVFVAQAEPAAEISEILVSFTPSGQSTHLKQMELRVGGLADYEIPISQLSLAPFTQITYSFEARWKDGTKASSQEYTLNYSDTRYSWQSLEDGIFEVHWNGG